MCPNLVDGLNKNIDFPKLDKKNSETPIFRSTVYWNPSIKTDGSGKATIDFNLADDIGVMEVRIDGMTSNGIPFSTNYPFEVIMGNRKN